MESRKGKFRTESRMVVTMLGWGWGKRGDVFEGYKLPAVRPVSSVDLK